MTADHEHRDDPQEQRHDLQEQRDPEGAPSARGEAGTGADAESRPDPEHVAAIALLSLPEMGTAQLAALLDRWPDPVEAARAVREGRAASVAVDADRAALLRGPWRGELDLARAEARLVTRGAHVLLDRDGSSRVPPGLPDRPPVLLAEGDRLDALDAPRVAVVGTRAATPHGVADAEALGAFLAEHGVTVVSGMAIGIDGAVHRGCLDGGGAAVGVLATGLDIVYPRRHDVLFRRVRASGLLLSELPYGTPPHAGRFPVRNRIIAALADVVVVVEAKRTGGARITAEHAMEHGTTVMAVPGSRRNAAAAGCNALIADGAHPLLDPSDVLVELGMTSAARRGWSGPSPPAAAPSGDAKAVLAALGGEPATTDQLCSRTGLTPPRVAVAVAQLARERLVARERGMIWPR